jgi:chromosome segregation ATPase
MQVHPQTEHRQAMRPSTSWPELNLPRWDNVSARGTEGSWERFRSELGQSADTIRSLRGVYDRILGEARSKIRHLEEQIQLLETKNRQAYGKEIANLEKRRMLDLEGHSNVTRRLGDQLQEALGRERNLIDALDAEERKCQKLKKQVASLRSGTQEQCKAFDEENMALSERVKECEAEIGNLREELQQRSTALNKEKRVLESKLQTQQAEDQENKSWISNLEATMERHAKDFEEERQRFAWEIQKSEESKEYYLQALRDVKKSFEEMAQNKEDVTNRMRQYHADALQAQAEKQRFEELYQELQQEKEKFSDEVREWKSTHTENHGLFQEHSNRAPWLRQSVERERVTTPPPHSPTQFHRLPTPHRLSPPPHLPPVQTSSRTEAPLQQFETPLQNTMARDFAVPPFQSTKIQPLTITDLHHIITTEMQKMMAGTEKQQTIGNP